MNGSAQGGSRGSLSDQTLDRGPYYGAWQLTLDVSFPVFVLQVSLKLLSWRSAEYGRTSKTAP